MTVIAADTETFPIRKDHPFPEFVCLSYAYRDEDGEIVSDVVSNGDSDVEEHVTALFQPGHDLVFHNAAYDLIVLCIAFPEVEPLVWAKLEAGEIDDTLLREKMLNLSTTGSLTDQTLPDGSKRPILYGMAALVMDYLGIDLSEDKEDRLRTTYYEVDGLPSSRYSIARREYARMDAVYTLRVYECQGEQVESESGPASFSTSPFHAAAHFALGWMTDSGMQVDHERFWQMTAELDEALSDERLSLLSDAGIMRPSEPSSPNKNQLKRAAGILADMDVQIGDVEDWEPYREALIEGGVKFKKPKKQSIVEKELHAKVEEVCERLGLAVKLTDTGRVSCSKEVIAELAPHDPVIKTYQDRQALQKLVTTYLPQMMWEGELSDRVHFPFNALVETGRSSSKGDDNFPSANGQNQDPRVRPVFKAREGHLLVSTDYSTLELACVGQTTLDIFGESVHAQKINDGYDLHAYLGSRLAAVLDPWFRAQIHQLGSSDPEDVYAFFLELKFEKPKFFKHWRKFAKPVGLGYPGGLGPFKFIGMAKRDYKVDIIAEAVKRYDESPEEFEVTRTLRFYAKIYEQLDEDGQFVWTDLMKGISLAYRLREIWFQTYPEMPRYFKFVKEQLTDPQNPALGYSPEGKPIVGHAYTSPLGMHRAGAKFTDAANGCAMQTPAAEGAKLAVFRLVRACRDWTQRSVLYGCVPVDFIHDEVLIEIPEDDMFAQRVAELERVMEESMREILPDVAVGTESAVTRRWFKEADPVFNADDELVPWEPEQEREERDGKLYLVEEAA